MTVPQTPADTRGGRKTPDKTPAFDPAAAPLGADDEAGGAAELSSIAAERRERREGDADLHPNASQPELAPEGAMKRGSPIVPILVGALLAVVSLGLLTFILL